jgi:hypothetical protein
VATLCSYCGTPLPKEDARFCANCGMLVPSHPFSPKTASVSSPPVSAAPAPDAPTESAAREQAGVQPWSATPMRPGRYAEQDKPPAWMNQLDNATLVRPFTPLPAIPQTDQTLPAKELHVKVWGQAEEDEEEEREEHEQGRQATRERVVEEDVIDLPTKPLLAESPDLKHTPGTAAAITPPAQSRASQNQDVEYLDTVPLMTPKRANPPSLPPEGFAQHPQVAQRGWAEPRNPASQAGMRDFPVRQSPATASRNPMSQSGVPFAAATQPTSHAPYNPASVPGLQQGPQSMVSTAQERSQAAIPLPQRTAKPKSRVPLLVAIALIALLVIGGVTAWIIQAQPFTVPAVTQPQKTFSSQPLGFSLSYPNGWTAKTNAGKGSVYLSDSSQTDQVTILVQSNTSNSPSQALQQEVSQLKMTNQQKGLSPVSFAGTTWQQAKGSVFVQGATYSGLVLVASHNHKLFTIVQLAPQSTFAQEDQLVFAPMRSTFQFLP